MDKEGAISKQTDVKQIENYFKEREDDGKENVKILEREVEKITPESLVYIVQIC